MGNGFHVEPEQLESHAETVGQVGEAVNEAASAASTEGFGGLVYGVLFDGLVVPALSHVGRPPAQPDPPGRERRGRRSRAR